MADPYEYSSEADDELIRSYNKAHQLAETTIREWEQIEEEVMTARAQEAREREAKEQATREQREKKRRETGQAAEADADGEKGPSNVGSGAQEQVMVSGQIERPESMQGILQSGVGPIAKKMQATTSGEGVAAAISSLHLQDDEFVPQLEDEEDPAELPTGPSPENVGLGAAGAARPTNSKHALELSSDPQQGPNKQRRIFASGTPGLSGKKEHKFLREDADPDKLTFTQPNGDDLTEEEKAAVMKFFKAIRVLGERRNEPLKRLVRWIRNPTMGYCVAASCKFKYQSKRESGQSEMEKCDDCIRMGNPCMVSDGDDVVLVLPSAEEARSRAEAKTEVDTQHDVRGKAAGKAPVRTMVDTGESGVRSAAGEQGEMNIARLCLDDDEDDPELQQALSLSLAGTISAGGPSTAASALLAAATGDKRGNAPSSDPAEEQVSKGPKLDAQTTTAKVGKARTHENAKARTNPKTITFVASNDNNLTAAEMREVRKFWTPIHGLGKRNNKAMVDLASWLDESSADICAFAATTYHSESTFTNGQSIQEKCDECEKKGNFCMRRVGPNRVAVVGAVGEVGGDGGGEDVNEGGQ